MTIPQQSTLTDRQQRELDYHREHAKANEALLERPFPWEVLDNPETRWWNAYWAMYAYFVQKDLRGKKVLVVGCGFGDDALRLAKLGAEVSAFDLSPDSLRIARELALRERLDISFEQMPAEAMRYGDSTFDYILARDILHHVDIAETVKEIVRVAKQDATFVINEIYSHSVTDKLRQSALVRKIIYPRMQQLIYGPGKPYITEDERKLTELDLAQILSPVKSVQVEKHFNFLVTRIFPDRFEVLSKVDRLLLMALKPIGRFLAGRVFIVASIRK